MQKALPYQTRASHSETTSLGAEGRAGESEGGCRGFEVGVLQAWGAIDRGPSRRRWPRSVGTTVRRCGWRLLTLQESLLPQSGGRLGMSTILQTFAKSQLNSHLLLPLHQFLLSSPISSRHLFLLPRFPKGLAKLVTKARGLS